MEATPAEIDRAVTQADNCVESVAALPPRQIGALLDGIAAEMEALQDELIERAVLETVLAVERLKGERARTTNHFICLPAWCVTARGKTREWIKHYRIGNQSGGRI